MEMGKTEITVSKPVYLGQAILDLSKTLMHEFHYDYMRPKYSSKVNLCYVDTNSFVYQIEAKDFYRDIAKDVKKGLIRVDIQRMIIHHYPSQKIKR